MYDDHEMTSTCRENCPTGEHQSQDEPRACALCGDPLVFYKGRSWHRDGPNQLSAGCTRKQT